VQPASDADVRGLAILDAKGIVQLATETTLAGRDLSYQRQVREALSGRAVTSDLYLAPAELGSMPSIAYLMPVRARDQAVIGVVALWVRAEALWQIMKASNALAGQGSFAVLFDHSGIRIAHSYDRDIVFHPGGQLDAPTIDELVAEGRFGPQTRELLGQVRAFPDQYARALADSPSGELFRGFAPVNQKWNYGVARRFRAVPWTVFYMMPEEVLNAQLAVLTDSKLRFAGVIILLALAMGALFAAVILRPIRSLSAATEALASGDLGARVSMQRKDELGDLGASFNAMAGRIQNRQIKEAGRLESEFLANLSHELRTPLNSIIGFAQLLHDGDVGPVESKQQEFLGDILTSGRHLLQLINDVLDLSKVEAGKMEFRPESVDLGRIFAEVSSILRTTSAKREIRVDSSVSPELDAIVVDAARFKQVLYNYLSNALKFTPRGGKVSVRALPEGASQFRLEVEDTGVGIAPENIERLFTEFQQLGAGAAKRHGGTGLGLALTKRLVEAQGGSVGVRSTPGKGSTFNVVLPRRSAGIARTPKAPVASPGSR